MEFIAANLQISIADDYIKSFKSEKDFIAWSKKQKQWNDVPENVFSKVYRNITGKTPKEEKEKKTE